MPIPTPHAAPPDHLAPPSAKRRGNPDLHLAPRCGAKTRAGCPCRAPAVHGKQRCRMHGGRSTGPRTEHGLVRLRAARTIHGQYSAEARAQTRYSLTLLRRGRVGNDAVRYLDWLPPEFFARLQQMPPPFPASGLTAAEDRALLQAEAVALAPWKQAIARAGRPCRQAAGPCRDRNPMHQSVPRTRRRPPRRPCRLQRDKNPMHQKPGVSAPPTAAAPARAAPHAPDHPTAAIPGDAADRSVAASAKSHAPAPALSAHSAPATPPPAAPHAPDHPTAAIPGAAADRSVAASAKPHAPAPALSAPSAAATPPPAAPHAPDQRTGPTLMPAALAHRAARRCAAARRSFRMSRQPDHGRNRRRRRPRSGPSALVGSRRLGRPDPLSTDRPPGRAGPGRAVGGRR